MTEPIYESPRTGAIHKGDKVYFNFKGQFRAFRGALIAHSYGRSRSSEWINGSDDRGRVRSWPISGITRVERSSVESGERKGNR